MFVSRCCKDAVWVYHGNEGTSFYVCAKCDIACDVIIYEKGNSMPKFSQQSFSRLATCHIELQTLFYEVIKYFDCTIICGHRGQAEQEAAFLKGATKLHWPKGKHNSQPSMAVDVAPWPLDWMNEKRFYWFAGVVMATAERLKAEGKMTQSVRWGGDWDRDLNFGDQTFNDLTHFELV